jgi:ADP-ribosylglycohydrolase
VRRRRRDSDPDQAVARSKQRAIRSLEGLALGDAFGEQFFVGNDEQAARLIAGRVVPAGEWRWTDDTAMAIPIVDQMLRDGAVDADRLAAAFARHYVAEPARGYGRGTHEVLGAIAQGKHWSTANRLSFKDGSRGNGAAMRSAPIGGYFASATDLVVRAARASAIPTHAHPDAVAGAIAVAVASGYAATLESGHRPGALLEHVVGIMPGGAVRDGIELALTILDVTPIQAAAVLGSGQRVLAEDTVPFAIWCADRHLESVEEALWAAVSGLGDRDTTCAMVGGIVAVGDRAELPAALVSHREALPSPAGGDRSVAG